MYYYINIHKHTTIQVSQTVSQSDSQPLKTLLLTNAIQITRQKKNDVIYTHAHRIINKMINNTQLNIHILMLVRQIQAIHRCLMLYHMHSQYNIRLQHPPKQKAVANRTIVNKRMKQKKRTRGYSHCNFCQVLGPNEHCCRTFNFNATLSL